MSNDLHFDPSKIDWLDIKGLDAMAILHVLPHRFPFLLVDRVLEVKTAKPVRLGMSQEEIDATKKGSYSRTFKNVSFNEPQFSGHFPENPILPGVMTLETMAQSAAFIMLPYIALNNNGTFKKFDVFLAGFDNVRFRRPIRPGDQLHVHATLTQFKKNVLSFSVEATIEGKKAAEADLLAQILW